MKLVWSDYKSDGDSRSVWFAGGFVLYVLRLNRRFRRTKDWRIYWYEAPEIAGLWSRKFATRAAAQRAAEAVFVPMLVIAPRLVKVTISVSTDGPLVPQKRRKKGS